MSFRSNYIPRSYLTQAQHDVLMNFVGEMIEDGHFIGDRAELAGVFSAIAAEFQDNGDLQRAYQIEQLAPDGFFSLTWEEYQKQHATHDGLEPQS